VPGSEECVFEEASHLHAVRQTGRWRCCWGVVGPAIRQYVKIQEKEADHPPRQSSVVVAGRYRLGYVGAMTDQQRVVSRSEPSSRRSSFVVAEDAAGGVGGASCLTCRRERHAFPWQDASVPLVHVSRHRNRSRHCFHWPRAL
jgi:hypothetical protein